LVVQRFSSSAVQQFRPQAVLRFGTGAMVQRFRP